jgi:hypothetical protein
MSIRVDVGLNEADIAFHDRANILDPGFRSLLMHRD